VAGPLGAAEAAVRVGGHQVEVAVGPKEDGLPEGVG